MTNEKRNPVARPRANRVRDIKTEASFDWLESTADPLTFQVAFVARRYRLSPCLARLVCQLADLGGRLA